MYIAVTIPIVFHSAIETMLSTSNFALLLSLRPDELAINVILIFRRPRKFLTIFKVRFTFHSTRFSSREIVHLSRRVLSHAMTLPANCKYIAHRGKTLNNLL